jgi:endonuclease YncB( thermonuclease family)
MGRLWTILSAMTMRPYAIQAKLLCAAAVFTAGGAGAGTPAFEAVAGCVGSPTPAGEVAGVIDGRSFRLADGREVRLAAIEAPPLLSVAPDDRTGPGVAAKAALEALVLHHSVAMKISGPGPDRYGRVIAYVFVGGSTDAPSAPLASVQGELLSRGYALLAPSGEIAACRGVLRTAERAARDAKLGLWGDPYYVMKQAENVADVLAERGRFAVVAGKVASVRESGGIVYVNFGRRWSEDFTVTILKRNERLFVGAGMEPKKLAGRHIEVRGWVEEHGGPAIEAGRPEQIEIVERN